MNGTEKWIFECTIIRLQEHSFFLNDSDVTIKVENRFLIIIFFQTLSTLERIERGPYDNEIFDSFLIM